jgi:hypothetical protein
VSETFHIDENKIRADIRRSCLTGGRFCLSGTRWLLEYDVNSEYWLDERGQPKTGALTQYTGKKKDNRSVVIGDGKRICCIKSFMNVAAEKIVSPNPSVFTPTESIFTSYTHLITRHRTLVMIFDSPSPLIPSFVVARRCQLTPVKRNITMMQSHGQSSRYQTSKEPIQDSNQPKNDLSRHRGRVFTSSRDVH